MAFFYSLKGGRNYTLRYAAIAEQAFTDQIFIQAFPTVLNDDCQNAHVIPDLAHEQLIILDTREATESINVSCEDSTFDNLDLWYAFTMPFDGQLEIKDVFGVNKLALFDSCGGNELACQIANGFFDNLFEGKEYLLRYSAISQHANRDEFTVQAFPFISNDECMNAIEIFRIDSLQTISLDTRNATESMDMSCEDSTVKNLDLWYQFIMPFHGDIVVSEMNNAHNVSLWSACDGPEFFCFYGSGIFSGLTDSTTYYLRYASSELSAWSDSFKIAATMGLGFEVDWPNKQVTITVFPNPVVKEAILGWETNGASQNKLYILDLSGKIVFGKELGILPSGGQNYPVSLEGLAAGLYIVHIQTENQLFRGKIIKH